MSSFGPKLALGLALISTIVPKTVPKFDSEDVRQPPESQTVAFLSRHGFEAHTEQRRFGRLVHGTSGECRLRVLGLNPNGSTRDQVRLIATETDRIAFVFDGEIYSEQPMLLTVLSHRWTRLRNKIGLPAPMKSVFGVAASRDCSLERLPWREIAGQRTSGPA